jgi:hypothetical protein
MPAARRYDGRVTLVGDRERERTAESLRRHYLSGRLTVDELAERTNVALSARSHGELASALRDLPLRDDALDAARRAGRTLVRGGVILAMATIWAIFSVVLLIAFAVAMIAHGPTIGNEVGFPIVWIVGSWLLWRPVKRVKRRTEPPLR